MNTIHEDKIYYLHLKFKFHLLEIMLKLRLKKVGRKGSPTYRLVIMEHKTRRDGRPIEEVGFYNPISKESSFNSIKINHWLKVGAKPTSTVFNLLKKEGIV